MSDMKNTAVVLIPVYKPDESLLRLCEALGGFALVVADDGSGAAYNDILRRAEEYGVVLRLEKHSGRGAALKRGYRYIGESEAYVGCTHIVTADAASDAADVVRVAEAAEAGGVVLGVGTVQSAPRRLTGFGFRIAAGKGVSDATTGLRAVPREHALRYAALPGKGFEVELNQLFDAVEEKTPITEVAVDGAAAGSRRFRPVVDTVRLYWAMFLASRSLKYVFSSGVAFVIDYALLVLIAGLLNFEGSVELVAAPAAWLVSSLTNFFMNRNFVFRSDTPLLVALPEYYGLAGVVFLLKTYVLLELLVRALHIPLAVAKPVAEVVFFISNYFIQKKFIFKKK